MDGSRPLCRICGDIARGYNFGVITCMPCKAFFRRNALRTPGSLTCMKDNDCTINKDNRSDCSACRLQKCFIFGMKRQAIRVFDQSDPSDDWQNNLPLPQPIGLLRQDRSMMTMDEWDILSNLTYLYERQNIFHLVGSPLAERSKLPIKMRSKISLSTDFLMKTVTCVENIVAQSYDVRRLSIAARHRLVKNNAIQVGGFNAAMVDKHLGLCTNDDFSALFSKTYTPVGHAKVIRLIKKMDDDMKLLEILLFIMMFSTNFSIVRYDPADDMRTVPSSLELFRIQNKYATTLWKYMEYRFGETETVLRYSSMVMSMIEIHDFYRLVNDEESFRLLFEEVTIRVGKVALANG